MAPRTAQTAASSRPRRGVNPVATINQTAAFSRPKRTIRQPDRYTPEAPTRVKKRATIVAQGQQKRRTRKTRADRGSTRARKSALPIPAPGAQQDRDGDVDMDGGQEEDVEMNTPSSPVSDEDASMHDRNDDDDDAPGAAQHQQPSADWNLDILDNEDGAGQTHQAPEERDTPKEDRMEDQAIAGGDASELESSTKVFEGPRKMAQDTSTNAGNNIDAEAGNEEDEPLLQDLAEDSEEIDNDALISNFLEQDRRRKAGGQQLDGAVISSIEDRDQAPTNLAESDGHGGEDEEQQVGPQAFVVVDLTNESDGDESDSEEEDEPTEETVFLRKVLCFHVGTADKTDDGWMILDLHEKHDFIDLHEVVQSVSDSDIFSNSEVWVAISRQIEPDYPEVDRKALADRLMHIYLTVVLPVFPTAEMSHFIARLETRSQNAFKSQGRYARDLVIAIPSNPVRFRVCPYRLSKVVEGHGGYSALERSGDWEGVARQLGIEDTQLSLAPVYLRAATRDLLEPLKRSGGAGSAPSSQTSKDHKQPELAAQQVKASKKSKLPDVSTSDDLEVDVEALKLLLQSKETFFNRTTDIERWNDIAESLGIRQRPNCGTLLKRHWRWAIQAFENEAAEKRLLTMNPPRTAAWKQSAFYDAYKDEHGKPPQAVVIANIIEDLGGKDAIDAQTNEKFDWLYVVKEIWFKDQDMTEEDWHETAENIETAANFIVGMVDALKQKELEEGKDQPPAHSPTKESKTQKRKASINADSDEQPPQKRLRPDDKSPLMPPPTSMPPPHTPGSGSNRAKARSRQSRMSAPSLPTETGYSVPGATSAMSAGLVGNATSTPTAASHGYGSSIEEVQRIATVAPMSSSPSAIGLSPSTHTDMNSNKALHGSHRSGSMPRQSPPLSARTPDQWLDFVKAAGRSPAVKKAASEKSKDESSHSTRTVHSPRSPPTDAEWNENPKGTEAPATQRVLSSPRSPPSDVSNVADQDSSKAQHKPKSRGRAVPPPSLPRSTRAETPGPESPDSSRAEASEYTGRDPRLARMRREAPAPALPGSSSPEASRYTGTDPRLAHMA